MKKIVLIMFCLMMLLLFSACNQEGDSMGETELKLCDHNFVDGTCKKCGALEPTSGLVYTLNDDGKGYTLTSSEFYNGNYYHSVVIADSYNGLPVTAIGEAVFNRNSCHQSYLTGIVIPDTVKSIGDNAFAGCDSMKNVSIGKNVASIGDSAFTGCRGLTSIKFPDSVTSIGDSAFSYCQNLITVNMGEGVTSIGKEAFYYCTELTTIYWSEKAVTVGQDAFTYCENLKKIHLANIASWCASDFVYSDRYREKSVTNPLEDGAKLYLNGELITDLVIPEGVTRISDYAFYLYDDLKSVTIPDSVTTIGSHAFYGCDNSAYKRYDTAYYLGNESNPYLCLMGTTSNDISGCNIHKDTKIIGPNAFSGCDFESIVLPEGLKSICAYAFYDCRSLKSIDVPNQVTYIGKNAFYYCTGLESITLSSGLTTIAPFTFYGCGIKEIVIPEGVTTLEPYAFSGSKVESITLPASLKRIGVSAFAENRNCNMYGAVKNVYITDLEAWYVIEFESSHANPLWNGATLYLNGEEVTELVIPDGVTSIGNYAFYGSKITSVTIPTGVTSIGDSAFGSCTKLQTITFAGTLEQWYAVSLGTSWNSSVPTKKIICSDGEANL